MKNRWMMCGLWVVCGLLALEAYALPQERKRLSLAGRWNSSLGECQLPGTTDENRLGDGAQEKGVTYQLTRLFPFSGVVDYTREVEIPASFEGSPLFLEMERTKPSTLWINGDSIGSFGHIYAPHRYALPPLAVGKHQVRIRVDNSDNSVPREIHSSHAWTDATQTNWNGILGDFFIEALPVAYLQSMQVFPQVEEKSATLNLSIWSDAKRTATLTIKGNSWNSDQRQKLKKMTQKVELDEGENRLSLSIDMGENPQLWSEFHPTLYRLEVALKHKQGCDLQTVDFGMREFTTRGNQFLLNGNVIFLRGKHDSCVFPLTGYASMSVEEWQRIFRIAKSYGINHYRCHSYTPPRAALAAADIEGIYFQIELPLWGAIDNFTQRLNAFMKREGDMLLDFMGNHPSFMMLGLGNELDIRERHIVQEWLDEFRSKDRRHLYCYGSNNNLGWFGAPEGEDFLVTCRVGGGDHYTTNTRSSFSFADEDKGGLLNNTRPATTRNFSGAIAKSPRPVVGHETCQFQIYPDYAEIEKYKGVLYPYNLEIFRERLKENGLTDQAEAFHRATGHFSVECYKADMEYAFRTPGFGGFQLLDLQDFPGQGTALVGILDAFMESKGIVDPKTFYGFCAPLVPLAIFSDHCWRNSQSMAIDIALSNYLEGDWERPVVWQLATQDGSWVEQGELQGRVAQGEVTTIGHLEIDLTALTQPHKVTLTLSTGEFQNYYHLWVYPEERVEADGLFVATALDEVLKSRLEKGERVLLIPDHKEVESQSVGGMFTPDYWNYAMFKRISENLGKEISPGTLSILTHPSHPMMRLFPTDEHSNWQWWSITRNSRPMILNATPAAYKPIVQVIDNIERNHKLGLVYEFAVGKGKLLVCMTDLAAIADTPEGNQFRTALLRYAASADFNPQEQLSWAGLTALFQGTVQQREIEGVENQSNYAAPQ